MQRGEPPRAWAGVGTGGFGIIVAMNALRPGRLIVATHELGDPNFAGTVLLLLDHGDDGAIGVVLNRPSTVPVSEPLPDCAYEVRPPEVVFAGGPVGRDTVIAVGVGTVVGDSAWQPVSEGLGILDLDQRAPEGLRGVRVFAGYAGWAPGQLEDEVEAGAWWVVDAPVEELLGDDPATMWRAVLRRQGGFFVTVPEDPTQN